MSVFASVRLAFAMTVLVSHSAFAQDAAEEAIQRLRTDFLYVGLSAIIPENDGVTQSAKVDDPAEFGQPVLLDRHPLARSSVVRQAAGRSADGAGLGLYSSTGTITGTSLVASNGISFAAGSPTYDDTAAWPSPSESFIAPSAPLPGATDGNSDGGTGIPVVPVPASLILLGSALAFVAGVSRRKQA